MKLFCKHHDKSKDHAPPPTFTDDELGIRPSPAERESRRLEKMQEDLTKTWHSEKPTYSARALDIITDDIVRKRERRH